MPITRAVQSISGLPIQSKIHALKMGFMPWHEVGIEGASLIA